MDPDLRQLVDAATASPAPPLPEPWPARGQPVEPWAAEVRRLRGLHEEPVAQALAAAGQGDLPAGVAETRRERIEVPGGTIDAWVYRPDRAGPHPAVLLFHGGGWWVGGGELGLAAADSSCAMWCAQTGAVVVNVDYRLAPEHRFPVPLEDCYAAACWLHAQAATLDVRVDRIGVSGVSAGANLAAAVTLLARQRSGPRLCFQQLIVPALDATLRSPSIANNGRGTDLTESTLRRAWDYYAGPVQDRTDPQMSPLLAADLTGLPAAQVIVGEHDPVRDDGVRYADRLRAAGVPVSLCRLDMTHGVATPQVAAAYLEQILHGLRTGLRPGEEARAPRTG